MADGNNGQAQSSNNMWPSTAVALGMLAIIGVAGVSAIWRYDTIDDALKIWAVLGTLIGVVSGAFVAYFFTKDQVGEAQGRADKASEKAMEAKSVAQMAIDQLPDQVRQTFLGDLRVQQFLQ